MVDLDNKRLERALGALGELLEDRGEQHDLVVIGGGSLLLQGQLSRTTEDLDVVARILDGGYLSAEPLPSSLVAAIVEVARLFSLSEKWLNAGPADLLRLGLPTGFDERKEERGYQTLTLHMAGRLDQIAFKLYAAVDRGPESKHFLDLKNLQPTDDELLFGARWSITHDPSEAFRDQLSQALEALGVDNDEFS